MHLQPRRSVSMVRSMIRSVSSEAVGAVFAEISKCSGIQPFFAALHAIVFHVVGKRDVMRSLGRNAPRRGPCSY